MPSYFWLTGCNAVLSSLLENIQNWCCQGVFAEMDHVLHSQQQWKAPRSGKLQVEIPPVSEKAIRQGTALTTMSCQKGNWSGSNYWALSTQTTESCDKQSSWLSDIQTVHSNLPPETLYMWETLHDPLWAFVRLPLAFLPLIAWMTVCGNI